jgi:hypothetical protein
MFLGTALDYRRLTEVELLIGLGGFTAYQTLTNSECCQISPGVRLRALRSVAEREITQISD